MILERSILVGVTIISLLLILVIPRDKIRLALVAFSVKQFITTILGHVVVESGALAYPVREFAQVNRTSFIYEFLAYPMLCAVFNVYYPTHRNRLWQIGYYVLFCTVFTIIEVIIELNTNLILYIRWNWFWTWGTLLITFMITRVVCVAFFRTVHQDNETCR
jgi:hypothetical protein